MAWVTPRTWTTTELVTAAIMNSHVRDNLAAAFPNGTDYQAWTPTLANMTLGNGAVVARYTEVGKTCLFRFSFTMGSTSSMGTAPTFTLPVSTSATYLANHPLGVMTVNDAGTAVFEGMALWSSATVCAMYVAGAAAAVVNRTGITSTVPMTWTTGDWLTVSGAYEVA